MQRLILPLLLALVLGLTALAYAPGLRGEFLFDDRPNIVDNARLEIQDLGFHSLKRAALSMAAGPLMRPISMASFAANRYASGLDPYYFKLTNLLIHLCNGLGIFLLCSLLLTAYSRRCQPDLSPNHMRWLSLAVAAAWLLHPMNLTSVLYVVQRMNSLSALFCIWGLVLYTWGRARLDSGGRTAIIASVVVFTPLALLSKENGALLPLLMLVVEFTLFNFETREPRSRKFLLVLFAICVALPAVLALAYLALHPETVLAGYANRDFSLSERLLTEARVLWFYLFQTVLPSTTQLGLFHDDIEISRSLLAPWTTLLSVMGILGLLTLSFLVRKRAPLVAFAVLFFLAGHSLESSVFSLEIAHEHRNYLPMFGVLLALFFYLTYPLSNLSTLRLRQAAAILLLVLLGSGSFVRARQWSDPLSFAQAEEEHHPRSVRAINGMGLIYASLKTEDQAGMEMNYLLAREHYEKSIVLDSNTTQALFNLITLSAVRKKPVERAWLEELKRRLEFAPFAADEADKLHVLISCRVAAVCMLSSSEFADIFAAALRNKTLIPAYRAGVLSAQSHYEINVLRDYPAALASMAQMVEAEPGNLENRMTLIKFQIAGHRIAAAKAQLLILAGRDKWQTYRAEIEAAEKLLLQSVDQAAPQLKMP